MACSTDQIPGFGRRDGNIAFGNGQVAEGWSKVAVCSVWFLTFHLCFIYTPSNLSHYLAPTAVGLPALVYRTKGGSSLPSIELKACTSELIVGLFKECMVAAWGM
jgi:hypothetical protein